MYYKGKYSRHIAFQENHYSHTNAFIRRILGSTQEEYDDIFASVYVDEDLNPYSNKYQANIFFINERDYTINYTRYGMICSDLPSYSVHYLGDIKYTYMNLKPNLENYHEPYSSYKVNNYRTNEVVVHNIYQDNKSRPNYVCDTITIVNSLKSNYIQFVWIYSETHKITMICIEDSSITYKRTNGENTDEGSIEF